MLKSSVRNCKFFVSVKRKFFSAEKSHCCTPGPVTMLRPALPNCPICAVASSRSNAPGLNQHCAVPVCAPLLAHVPLDGSPTKFGRSLGNPEISGAPPCAETPAESYTVNGVPVCNVVMPFTCQPPSTRLYQLRA